MTPRVSATFDALRFVEMTRYKFLGGEWAVHVIVPIIYQRVDMGGLATKGSVGDIIFDPFILAWHHPHWHAAAAMDMVFPTGHYEMNDPRVSVGAHYYTFEPIAAFSYLPKSGWETSIKLMYDLRTTNPATNYLSGQEFHADYVAGKHLGPWMVGASGYVVSQTTNDLVNGQIVAAETGMWDAGRRGQALAVGPSIAYRTKRHVMFLIQWQHEAVVRDRFGGDKFWFKVIVPGESLFGKSKPEASVRPPDQHGD
jgi:hypothetical protein